MSAAEAATERRVEGAGVELAVSERGTGPPALFIHGIASDRTIWRETLEALGDGTRAIAYDRRGYGESTAPEPYEGTSIEEQAEDAVAVLEALDAAPAVVCGHSLGAVVALDLLKRHRELVKGAVLIEPPLYSLSPIGSEAAGRLLEVATQGTRDAGAPGFVAAVLAEICGSTGVELAGPERSQVALASARTVAVDLPAPPSWQFARRELRAIEVPTVVLYGTRSWPVFQDASRGIAELLGAARLRELDSAHLVMLEYPGAVAEEVTALAVT